LGDGRRWGVDVPKRREKKRTIGGVGPIWRRRKKLKNANGKEKGKKPKRPFWPKKLRPSPAGEKKTTEEILHHPKKNVFPKNIKNEKADLSEKKFLDMWREE